MNKIEYMKERYFQEVNNLSYDIENAKTFEDFQAIGQKLLSIGTVFKYRPNFEE